MERVPTVNDLRVKLCYICREEERYDAIEVSPRRWVHPCKCTLVAHEECLLDWIKAGEANPSKPISTILKCPQCGSKYGLDSKNPLMLKILDNFNEAITISAHGATVLALGAVVASIGAGVYILFTSYGAFALQRFVGDEMFKLILTDEPTHWPFHAYINLPMIPLSLILSNTKKFRDTLPLLPILLFWPSTPPINNSKPSSGLFSSLNIGKFLKTTAKVQSPSEVELDTIKGILFSWPPSPAMFCWGVPIVRAYYRLWMKRLRNHVLGVDASSKNEEDGRGNGLRDVLMQNFRVEMNIQDEVADLQGVVVEPGPAAGNDAPAVQDDNNVELVLEGAPGQAEQVQEVANVDVPQVAPAPAPAAPANANDGQADRPDDRPAGPVRLRVSGGKLGRLLGGALLTPTISSLMGSLLLRLALPSGPNAHKLVNFGQSNTPQGLLRRFLAIKPPGSAPLIPATQLYKIPANAGLWTTMRYSVALTARLVFVGSPAWCGADPVWWRNTIGLGVWTVVRDLICLGYEYLSQQEVASRRLKDRPFTDINPKELDLRPDYLSQV